MKEGDEFGKVSLSSLAASLREEGLLNAFLSHIGFYFVITKWRNRANDLGNSYWIYAFNEVDEFWKKTNIRLLLAIFKEEGLSAISFLVIGINFFNKRRSYRIGRENRLRDYVLEESIV